MLKRHTLSYIWISLLFVASLGCSNQTKSIPSKLPSPTVDPSLLSNYILGGWSSIDVKSNDSEPIDLQYRILFQSNSRLKFTVIYPAGDSEGYKATYSFLNENSIYVDNLRITGGEIWLLEVKADKLVVTRNFDNKSTTIVLERTE